MSDYRNNFPRNNRQAGFTLVELLLVMGIFAILLAVITDMFVSVLNVQTEAKANTSVTQDGRYILSKLSYDISRATTVTTPEDLNVATSGITATTATVTWTTANTSNSRVEYGTTTAYGSMTTLNPSLVTAHSVGLSGLTAATTYHFRVLSQEADGTVTTSTDHTFVTTGGGVIAHVQTAAATDNTSAASIDRAFTASNVVGNAIVAAFSWGSGSTASCSDSLGNAYTMASSQYDSTNNQSLGICYATNIKAGANTVTITLGGASASRRLIIHEYRGISTVDPVDITTGNIANGTTAANNITSTAATTVVNGDLIFGAALDDAGTTTITAGTGFTQRNSVNNKDLVTQDMVQATAGSVASTMTFGAAHRYLSQMVAFKPISSPSASEAALGASNSKLTLVIGGITHTYALSGGDLRLTNNVGTNNLNSSDTSISNLSFQRAGNAAGKETIRISLTITSRSEPDQGARSRTFTITARRR